MPNKVTRKGGEDYPAMALPTGGLVIKQAKATATATALPAAQTLNGLTIRAKASNVGPVLVGNVATVTTAIDGSGVGFILEPGSVVSLPCANASDIYLIGTAGDVVSYAGN